MTDSTTSHPTANHPTTSPNDADRLTGRVALITGGAAGIGAATARALAARGARIAVNHRGAADRAQALVDELTGAGAVALAVRADVTDPGEVAAMVARTEAELGPVEVLVLNAAGVGREAVRPTPFLKTEWEGVERVVTAQLRAFYLPAKAVVPGMVERGSGSVVAVGAAMSRRPTAGFLPVAMGKSAVEAAVQTLAKELGRTGVRVNGVGPGLILSEVGLAMPEAARQANAERSALGRNGTPEDVAELIAFLASARSGYLTGSYLVADGGTSMA